MYLLSQVAKNAKHELDQRLARRGLRLRHMAVLAALEDRASPSQLELGRLLGLDPSDVTTTVEDLVAAGFVHRHVDRTDRRRRVVSISEAGVAELATLVGIAERVGDEVLHPLSATRRRSMHADLVRVLAALDAMDGG